MTPAGLADPRAAAALAATDVIDGGASLDDALAGRRASLDPADHALVQEIAYGTVRWYLLLEAWLGQLLKRPFKRRDRELHFLLATALYQLQWMRVPDHAVVDQAVKAAAHLGRSWARGVVNGVLRSFLRRGEEIRAAVTDPATRQAFPPWLYDRIGAAWPEQRRVILAASNQRPPMTLRVNLARIDREEFLDRLAAAGIAASPTRHGAAGLVLEKPRPAGGIPGFAEGLVSVQDESAQLAAPAMDLQAGMRVLDACTAPGGKSCHLLEAEPKLAELVAVDLPQRIPTIGENLERLGLAATVIAGDSTRPEVWWDGRPFQRIMVDAPCTGTGVIRRHPDIRHRRRAGDAAKFAAGQRRLLEASWPLLARGGKLLYMTCSILPEENEAVASAFLGAHADARPLPLPAEYGISCGAGRQRLPGVAAPEAPGEGAESSPTEELGDGFYYCLIEKE